MEHPAFGAVISDSDGDWWAVGVASYEDADREMAAREILVHADPDSFDWPDHEDEVVKHLAGSLKPETLREHGVMTESDEDDGFEDCSCEDSGWWCSVGDGDPFPFFTATRSQIDDASHRR